MTSDYKQITNNLYAFFISLSVYITLSLNIFCTSFTLSRDLFSFCLSLFLPSFCLFLSLSHSRKNDFFYNLHSLLSQYLHQMCNHFGTKNVLSKLVRENECFLCFTCTCFLPKFTITKNSFLFDKKIH